MTEREAKLERALARVATDDVWCDSTFCYWCKESYPEHETDCAWVEARDLLNFPTEIRDPYMDYLSGLGPKP